MDRTIPPRQAPAVESDVTMPGKRDRKPDGVFEPGDLIIHRYKVIGKLGQGGMGAVYKCLDETAGIEVALKALPPELSNDPMAMEDIKDNFQLVAKLVHQNIAISKQLEHDNSNGNYYLIMECCEGEDLRHWIRRKRQDGGITLDDVLPVIRQIADALDYAHEEKIIHRDIKPGNIMIDRSGKIKVLDFGLAAQIHSSMSMVSMAYTGTSGTGPYMSPEQWKGRRQGAPADQYALAVMTYEMLAGYLPFENSETAILQQAVLTQMPEEIKNIPKSAQEAIFRAMAKDPAERFATCSDFAAALGGKKIKGTKSAKGGNFGKWLLLMIILALLGGGAGYYFFDKQQKEQARLEELEKERLAKLAADKAEKERLAKLAADKAEKERLAKIAADKAEEERKKKEEEERKKKEEEARIAKLTEVQLDTENSALVVELEKKIAEIEQKNYAPTQGFDKKISEMKIAFATAQKAKLLITANKKYKEAKALADWILVNGEARKAALTAKNQAESNRRAAEKYEPATYASNLYNSACNAYKDGGKLFEELKFSEAKSRFESAANDFSKAEKSAFDNKLQFLSDKAKEAEKSAKWNELKVWAGKIHPLNSALAAQFRQKAEKELLAIAVEKELASARQAKSSGNWQQVHDYALAALKLDASNGEAKNLKQEAENKLIPTLEIIAYVNGNIVKPKIKALKAIPAWKETPWKLQKGNEYEFDVTYKSGDDEYYGKIPAFTCSANGPHQKTVYLKKVVFNGTVNLANGVKLEMVKVEPGTFTMSRRDGDNFSDEIEHTKTLTKTFYIGKYEVTQEQWSVIMGTTVRQQRDKANTSWPLAGEGSRFPIYNVSWHEAMEFCEKMNRYAPPGWKFTLPTETQWEFAARGGNNSRNYKYSGSNNIGDVAWYSGNSNFTTHEVGGKTPNELGLYDMSGNVLEWCLDNYNSKSNNTTAEFSRPYHDSDGSDRVYRGGSWYDNARLWRSAGRFNNSPGIRGNCLGFRLALVKKDKQVKQNKQEQNQQNVIRINLPKGVNLEMVEIKAGTFMMGSPKNELGRDSDETQHKVTLTKDYWLGKFEVTQAQYEAVMGNNPSGFKGANHPVENVTWDDAKDFCNKLNDLYAGKLPAGYKFDLPTEAQWEYACRAGTGTAFNNGTNWTGESGCPNLDKVGWFKGNIGGIIHHKEVGQKAANNWGLYDMHGNIAEWCEGYRHAYKGMMFRRCRGGNWISDPEKCRSAELHAYYKSESFIGFRLALVPEQ